jgi:flagellar motor switch protein FliN/FliY
MADDPLNQDDIERLIAEQAAAASADAAEPDVVDDAQDAELIADDDTDPTPAPDDQPDDPATAPASTFDTPLSAEDIAAIVASEAVAPRPPAPTTQTGLGAPAPIIEDVQLPELPEVQAPLDEVADVSLLLDVPLQITVELGQATRTIRELLELGHGSILHLTRHAGEPVDVLVNGQHIAKGEVVVIDENFGIRVTEVVSPSDRLRTMAA